MLLRARGLTATRTGDAGPVTVLAGVDIDIDVGTLVDLSGPSGSGKTTLLLALARLLPGVTGELALDGAPARSVDARVWRTRVDYLPQRVRLAPGTVGENLRLPWGLRVRREEKPPSDRVLRDALDSLSLPDVSLDRDVARLSVGQTARIAVLRSLLTRPECLLLDEPDASLDDDSAARVAQATDRFVSEGGAVVRVRHARVDDAADRRFRLAGGRLEELDANG